MKKFLSMTLLLTAMFLTFSACSSDDDETNYPDITGSWSEISETPGEYISSYMEVMWTFNSDNTATQRVILKFNNVRSHIVLRLLIISFGRYPCPPQYQVSVC